MPSRSSPVLSLILPCFNEEEVLPDSARKLKDKFADLVARELIDARSKIYFIDDGSTDSTWDVISGLVASDDVYAGIKFTRNFGHQYAVLAGLMHAEGDALISIDADLQDDINAIDEMVQHYRNGSEIVFGVRRDRHTDSIQKRGTAAAHYWLSAALGITTIPQHADFRLMSRKAVEYLREYPEKNLYLRGVVPTLGLTSSKVYYSRGIRVAGETKYRLRDMIGLSIRGITSFSIVPLRIISILGLVTFFISCGLGAWALIAALTGNAIGMAGWASTVIPIYVLGGIQLLALGVVGEYIGNIYLEAKGRPAYQIEQHIGHE